MDFSSQNLESNVRRENLFFMKTIHTCFRMYLIKTLTGEEVEEMHILLKQEFYKFQILVCLVSAYLSKTQTNINVTIILVCLCVIYF